MTKVINHRLLLILSNEFFYEFNLFGNFSCVGTSEYVVLSKGECHVKITLPHYFLSCQKNKSLENLNENKLFSFYIKRNLFLFIFFQISAPWSRWICEMFGSTRIRPDKNLSTKNLHVKFSLLNILIILLEAQLYNIRSEKC